MVHVHHQVVCGHIVFALFDFELKWELLDQQIEDVRLVHEEDRFKSLPFDFCFSVVLNGYFWYHAVCSLEVVDVQPPLISCVWRVVSHLLELVPEAIYIFIEDGSDRIVYPLDKLKSIVF